MVIASRPSFSPHSLFQSASSTLYTGAVTDERFGKLQMADHMGAGASSPLASLHARVLSNKPIDYTRRYSPQQTLILQILAALSAIISIIFAITAFYWFFMMRKKFRHILIMLLLVCNFVRAVGYLPYSFLIFRFKAVESESAFCQTSGFFIAFGTEAADFANLVLAVHTALHIFSPGVSYRQAGLYRIRYPVYICWFIFSVLLASLAFLNPHIMGGYVSQGTSCYLPIRPFWYRLALSWIPRYIILSVICGIQIAIYSYVSFRFKDVKGEMSISSSTPKMGFDGSASTMRRDSFVLGEGRIHGQEINQPETPLPDLLYHGLIAGTPPQPLSSAPTPACERSNDVREPSDDYSPDLEAARRAYWIREQMSASMRTADEAHMQGAMAGEDSSTMGILQALRAEKSAAGSARAMELDGLSRTDDVSPEDHNVGNGISTEASPSRVVRPTGLANSDCKDAAVERLRRTHGEIRRQLRLLFIYPLVYFLTWIPPFISHCLQYSDHYSQHPSFALACITGVLLPGQCAIDCLLFSTREKPWRQIPGSKGTLLSSFCFWTHQRNTRHRLPSLPRFASHGTTSHRSSILSTSSSSRAAYRRRAEELAEGRTRLKGRRRMSLERRARALATTGHKPGNGGLGRTEKSEKPRERTWWEEEGRRRKDSVWNYEPGATQMSGIPEGAAISRIGSITTPRPEGRTGSVSFAPLESRDREQVRRRSDVVKEEGEGEVPPGVRRRSS
ncbi:MAG: hypothetical protein M1817_005340 [Caeruleum heppii]|nr:MAG: hypothetical protein M1817_005340 [Caeruleum heppii]